VGRAVSGALGAEGIAVSRYVSVTRKEDPLDEKGEAISSTEWVKAVSEVDGMELYNGPPLPFVPVNAVVAFWQKYSTDPEAAPFVWYSGNIEVKNPDDALLRKLGEIARTLNARVIAETGETYDWLGRPSGFIAWSEYAPTKLVVPLFITILSYLAAAGLIIWFVVAKSVPGNSWSTLESLALATMVFLLVSIGPPAIAFGMQVTKHFLTKWFGA
jgi:hypothetical protein